MTPRKPFTVLCADPPWPFSDQLPGKGRGSSKHYECLTASAICAFPLPRLADDCWLFLWRPATHAQEALDVARSWGFRRAPSELVWRKMTRDGNRLRIGMGRSFRNCHETCLVFRRGKPERLSKALPSVFDAPRTDHSSKPDAFYRIVDLFAPGPKVELFARRQWPGWTCLGDELAPAPPPEVKPALPPIDPAVYTEAPSVDGVDAHGRVDPLTFGIDGSGDEPAPEIEPWSVMRVAP